MAEIPVERKKDGGGGLPWWLIPLLLLLLLIPLLFFLARGCDNNNAGVVTNANNGNANRSAAGTTANGNNNGVGANGNLTPVGADTSVNSNNAIVNSNGAGSAGGNANGSGATAGTGNNAGNAGPTVTDASFFAGVNDKTTLVGRAADLQNVRVNRVISDHVFTVKSGSGEMFVYLDESEDSGGGKEQQIKVRPGQTLNVSGDFRRVPNQETANEKNEKQSGLSAREFAQMKDQQVYLHGRVQQ